MTVINKEISLVIPTYCPKCGSKLHHVNALDTEAKIYIVFCIGSLFNKCRYCIEYEKNKNGDIVKCL